jgi:hypothetical protein
VTAALGVLPSRHWHIHVRQVTVTVTVTGKKVTAFRFMRYSNIQPADR